MSWWNEIEPREAPDSQAAAQRAAADKAMTPPPSSEAVERMVDRPALCRNQLRAEGKPYPRSGCAVCRNGGLVGCPYENRAYHAGQSNPTTEGE